MLRSKYSALAGLLIPVLAASVLGGPRVDSLSAKHRRHQDTQPTISSKNLQQRSNHASRSLTGPGPNRLKCEELEKCEGK